MTNTKSLISKHIIHHIYFGQGVFFVCFFQKGSSEGLGFSKAQFRQFQFNLSGNSSEIISLENNKSSIHMLTFENQTPYSVLDDQ